ncbi:MAG: hypothetical protein ACI8P3_000349 [Saprospiraceae bacterium]|jgi:hypothetical protein
MKNLKSISLVILITLTSTLAFTQEQATATMACAKNLFGATEILLDLNGEVNTEFWDKDYVRVVIQIKSNGVTKEAIKHLISKKRFTISGMRITDSIFEISMPNIDLPVLINGQEFHEELSFQIFLPQTTFVTMASDLQLIAGIP